MIKNQKEEMQKLRKDLQVNLDKIDKKDDFIGEREKKIYQLKKKTQELEKFKFVLDFKIKELKKDIAPREKEISNLREQTYKMD